MTKNLSNKYFQLINLYKKPSTKSEEIVTQMIYGENFSIFIQRNGKLA